MVKRLISNILIAIMLVCSLQINTYAQVANDEMRAVWISTIYNIDYPNPSYVGNEVLQKDEFTDILDTLQKIGINTVFVQVRPQSDAFYESDINPWSSILTGTQGKDPGYDPMAFMIEETHKRGMEFHAWLNPYRVTVSGTNVNQLAANHPARLNPDWLISYDNKLYYNPAHPEVEAYIVDTVEEIVINYDVDGIHFDDYFYPSYYPLPEGEGKDGVVANSRREDINEMVEAVSEAIDKLDSNVTFGISPLGIWKNKASDSEGSNTSGGEGYYSVFADATAWIENEWIDYIIPQIYWEIGHSAADYATLVKWWAELVEGTDVDLYIGQGIYKDSISLDIAAHIVEANKYDEIDGHAYFSLKDLMNNRLGVADMLTAYYHAKDDEVALPESVSGWYKEGTITTDGLNVRTMPSLTGQVITKLNTGEVVKVYREVNGWYHAELANGKIGYISKDYVAVSEAIRLVINAIQVKPPVAPYLAEGTTLVPIRIISEHLGAEVQWEQQTKTAIVMKDGVTIEIPIGSHTINVNGTSQSVALPAALMSDTTMVPIRIIAENLGAQVNWDQEEKIVHISK